MLDQQLPQGNELGQGGLTPALLELRRRALENCQGDPRRPTDQQLEGRYRPSCVRPDGSIGLSADERRRLAQSSQPVGET